MPSRLSIFVLYLLYAKQGKEKISGAERDTLSRASRYVRLTQGYIFSL